MEDRTQRMKQDADYAKYLNYIQTPEYLAQKEAENQKYKAKQDELMSKVQTKKVDEFGKEIVDRSFLQDFERGWNTGVDWIQENVQPITKYVPVLGQAVDVAVGLTDAAGAAMHGDDIEDVLKKTGKALAKTADVFIPGAEKAYNIAENTIEAAITGDLDKIKSAATSIASAGISSDAGKKALDKIKGEAEKKATDFISSIKL
jgi:hypothetical protein